MYDNFCDRKLTHLSYAHSAMVAFVNLTFLLCISYTRLASLGFYYLIRLNLNMIVQTIQNKRIARLV